MLVIYAPFWLTLLDPFHQIHCPVLCWYSQTSLKKPVPNVARESYPQPPNNQRLLFLSLHPTAPHRAPGTFVAAAVVTVPYTPSWLVVLLPDPQVHCPPAILISSFHRSLSVPLGVPAESNPNPPNIQRVFPAASIQRIPCCRPPGALPAAAVPNVP